MGSLLINKRPGSLDIKPASQSKPFQINDFIFLSEGASNSYLIETSEGNILINTGIFSSTEFVLKICSFLGLRY